MPFWGKVAFQWVIQEIVFHGGLCVCISLWFVCKMHIHAYIYVNIYVKFI